MIFGGVLKSKVAVVGLGYVGLPLAVEIAKQRKCFRTGSEITRNVIGFDINKQRIEELQNDFDRTNEISSATLAKLPFLEVTYDVNKLNDADVFIITVPTPIDSSKKPCLLALQKASETVGRALKQRSIQSQSSNNIFNPIVIYESTVYPGLTEEFCIPILENESELTFNSDKLNSGFYCGYSPERINPGDLSHRLADIVKVTSGSNDEVTDWIDAFYASFIKAGTYKVSSIKVAEASKVIENTQRDINIALVNEFSIIFNRLGIDTLDVLEAAGSKWNFLPFRPGLVGGHCIGVDPYYLTYKAQEMGYYPQIVLAGRRINDSMTDMIAERIICELAKKKTIIGGANLLVLGLSFKENCSDIRNTKIIDLVNRFSEYGIYVDVIDPWVYPEDAKEEYGLNIMEVIPKDKSYAAVVAAVAHKQFIDMPNEIWIDMINKDTILFDLKGIIPRDIKALRI